MHCLVSLQCLWLFFGRAQMRVLGDLLLHEFMKRFQEQDVQQAAQQKRPRNAHKPVASTVITFGWRKGWNRWPSPRRHPPASPRAKKPALPSASRPAPRHSAARRSQLETASARSRRLQYKVKLGSRRTCFGGRGVQGARSWDVSRGCFRCWLAVESGMFMSLLSNAFGAGRPGAPAAGGQSQHPPL